jgi:hypothetical protein
VETPWCSIGWEAYSGSFARKLRSLRMTPGDGEQLR